MTKKSTFVHGNETEQTGAVFCAEFENLIHFCDKSYFDHNFECLEDFSHTMPDASTFSRSRAGTVEARWLEFVATIERYQGWIVPKFYPNQLSRF